MGFPIPRSTHLVKRALIYTNRLTKPLITANLPQPINIEGIRTIVPLFQYTTTNNTTKNDKELYTAFTPPTQQTTTQFKTKSRITPTASEERMHKLARRLMLGGILFSAFIAYYLGREFTTEEIDWKPLPKDKDNQNMNAFQRARLRWTRTLEYYREPPVQRLLPDPAVPEGTKPPPVLVINLDGTMIKILWDKEHGYRAAKRPGLDRFLGLMSCFYEVILFTSQNEMNVEPIITKLDPYRMYFQHFLFRDATRWVNGRIVKDLSYINRDLNKVVFMDCNEEAYLLQPENAIHVPSWNGDPNDRYLLDMLPFLETLALMEPDDVRPILHEYYGKNIPREFSVKEENELNQIDSNQYSLRAWLNWFTNVKTIHPMAQKRLILEHNYDLQRPQMVQFAKQQSEQMMKENQQLLADQKITPWSLFTQSVKMGEVQAQAFADAQAKAQQAQNNAKN